MATQVYKKETFLLQNIEGEDVEVIITPLPIKYLRPFMEEFQNLMESKTDTEGTNVLFNCARIAVQARNKDVTEEQLEEMLDLPTIIKIVELAGGVSLDGSDPNPTGPATSE